MNHLKLLTFDYVRATLREIAKKYCRGSCPSHFGRVSPFFSFGDDYVMLLLLFSARNFESEVE